MLVWSNRSSSCHMAFKHCISFAAYLAANFGCNWFRIMPDIVSKLLCAANWSSCAVRLAGLLLCTGFDSEHPALFLCHIFTQRPMNDRKIERSDGRCFGMQQLLSNSVEKFISDIKKSELCSLTNGLYRFDRLKNHSTNCLDLVLFKTVTDAKIEPSVVKFLMVMRQIG